MKILIAFAAVFTALSILGFTVYFHDLNPWGGWFVALWFLSFVAVAVSLLFVGLSRAVDEIASGEVSRRRRDREAREAVRVHGNVLTAWCPRCRKDVPMTSLISGDITGSSIQAQAPCPRCSTVIDVIWPRPARLT